MKALISGITLLLLLMSFDNLPAQSSQPPSAFISTNGGVYIPKETEFSEYYGSNIGPTFGAAVGIPFGKRLYLYGKLSRFSKNTENEIEMWITNAGLKYAFPIAERTFLEVMGGFARAGVEQRILQQDGSYSTSEGVDIFGLFGGIAIEQRWHSFPLSITGEVLHNVSHKDLRNLISELDGSSFTFGVRYYLPPPKNK